MLAPETEPVDPRWQREMSDRPREASLVRLNEEFRLPHLPELVARKGSGAEDAKLTEGDLAFHDAEFDRLTGLLEDAGASSRLPDAPSARDALHDLLLRIRGVATGDRPAWLAPKS